MLSSADAIGKIQQIYMEGNRQVPYLTFMNVFNDLLEDPVNVVPKEPSDELAEKFRAACMAANVGVYDQEGRSEDRVREFKEKVYPAWQEALPPQKFEKYRDIIEGKLRERRAERKKAGGAKAEPGASRTSDLLQRLGITPAEAEEEETEPAREEVEGLELVAEPAEEAQTERAQAPTVVESQQWPEVFDTVDDLVTAIQQEELELDYLPRDERSVFARYMLGDKEVTVFLVSGNTRNYVTVSVDQGYPDALNVRQMADSTALEMGYRPTSEFYYRRMEGDYLLRIRLWPDRVDMACGYPKGADREVVVQQIHKLHRDLGELIERLR